MAIAAAHAFVEHFALHKRTVFEHFVLDFAIQRIQFTGERAGQVIIHQPFADGETVPQGRPARVAAGAGFDLDGRVLVLEVDGEAGMDQVGFFCRPFEVIRRRAMASLTAHAEAVPLTGEGAVAGVKVALEPGGVTFHAHEVGVLARLAPVQWVLEIHALAGIKMKPAMLLRIPRHAQGLQATVADFDQVLLQRSNAEGVGHFEVVILAIKTGRIDPELVTFARKTHGLLFGFDRDVVEVCEHGLGRGRLHRQLMVRTLPVFDLLTVAALALLFVDHCGGLDRRLWLAGRRRGDSGGWRARLGRHRGRAKQKPADGNDSRQQHADGHRVQVASTCPGRCNGGGLDCFLLTFGHCDFQSPDAGAVWRR